MKIALLDLRLQYREIKHEIQGLISRICDEQQFILGDRVAEFEAALADYSNSRFACAVSSGSDALLMALMAADIGPGDEVITTPYTFFATAGAIHRVGARPVFVDIDPATYNIDSEAISEALSERSRAIIVVHLYGQAVDIQPIDSLAKAHDLLIIEDAAQAIGSEYKGQRVGSLGDYGCLSFFPSKNLGAFGDAGMVLCQNETIYQRLHCLRVHGAKKKHYHPYVGGNFRLDALQAAVLQVKLRFLDQWTEKRQKNAADYRRLFAQVDLGDKVIFPDCMAYCTRHVYNQFCIRIPKGQRDRVQADLKDSGVETGIYYPLPLHLQQCFAYLGYKKDAFPHSEQAARETLALPIYPELTQEQRCYIVERIARILG